MPDKSRAVVLVSGGLDSCVTTALAAQSAEVSLLHATYGQRTAERELEAFCKIADHFAVPEARRRILDLRFLGGLGGSALTDTSIDVPEGAPGDGVPITYVPFRNAHLLAAAVSWAELLGGQGVWIGAVEEDSSGYPDCTEVFLKAFERATRLGTARGSQLEVRAPLLHLRKSQIIKLGRELEAPLELTWSCYQASERACGRCESCVLRLGAFDEAGFRDPIPYDETPSTGESG